MSKKQNKTHFSEEEKFVQELEEDFKVIKSTVISSVYERIEKIEKNLDLIERQIEILNDEIEYLKSLAEEYKSKGEYAKLSKINAQISAKISLVKRLYESYGDLASPLKEMYKLVSDTVMKKHELKAKIFKDISKLNKDVTNEDLIRVITELVTDKKNKESDSSKSSSELILEEMKNEGIPEL